MRERIGQDVCIVCGLATTFNDPAAPVCGSALCQAAYGLRGVNGGQAERGVEGSSCGVGRGGKACAVERSCASQFSGQLR
jgi:hypothetical protein